jgi:hypothetical protein
MHVAQAQEITSNQGSRLAKCDLSSSEGPPGLQQRRPDNPGEGTRGLGPGKGFPGTALPLVDPTAWFEALSMARSKRAT